MNCYIYEKTCYCCWKISKFAILQMELKIAAFMEKSIQLPLLKYESVTLQICYIYGKICKTALLLKSGSVTYLGKYTIL